MWPLHARAAKVPQKPIIGRMFFEDETEFYMNFFPSQFFGLLISFFRLLDEESCAWAAVVSNGWSGWPKWSSLIELNKCHAQKVLLNFGWNFCPSIHLSAIVLKNFPIRRKTGSKPEVRLFTSMTSTYFFTIKMDSQMQSESKKIHQTFQLFDDTIESIDNYIYTAEATVLFRCVCANIIQIFVNEYTWRWD